MYQYSKYVTCYKMHSLIFCLSLFFNFNVNKAIEEEFIIDTSEIIDNVTFTDRNFPIFFDFPSLKPTDHTAIQIVIFSGCMLLLVLTGLLLFRICCKEYSRRNESFFARSPSLNSFQELIRERLTDRPPTYHESQTSLNTNDSTNLPAYNELISNRTQSNSTSTLSIPTSPPVYTISSKIPTTYANNDLDLPFTECESDTDSPPSYHTSEGVVNSVAINFVQSENNIESQNHTDQNLSGNPASNTRITEFYI